jgi:hypothetical protein
LFDTSKELTSYYENHVRLGTNLRNALAEHRERNLERLVAGLQTLGDKRKTNYKTYVENKNQGSYAMHTLNQCAHADYDIDVAVIWNDKDLPQDAKAARELIRDALLEKCSNFSKEPTARGNAVTVWYADGYHIDFAVYRRILDSAGNVVRTEHAGSTGWATREPLAFSNWFNEKVTSLSPPTLFDKTWQVKVDVPAGQLRRIVRFVKSFARSRSGWSLPGGIVISTLVQECYMRDPTRDDVALVNTLRALLKRLQGNLEVNNPIQAGASLVQTEKRKNEVARLRDRLAEKLPALDVLDQSGCTRSQAMKAWFEVFNHSYWSDVQEVAPTRAAFASSQPLLLQCWVTRNAIPSYPYQSDGVILPKGLGLQFTAKAPGVMEPYQFRWRIQNEGDEAREACFGKMSEDTLLSSSQPMLTSTAYKGRHKMLCEVVKNGCVVRRGEFIVRVGAGK